MPTVDGLCAGAQRALMRKSEEPLSPEVLRACARQAAKIYPACPSAVAMMEDVIRLYGLRDILAAMRQLKCRRSLERARRARVN